MTRAAFVTRVVKPVLYVAATLPFAWLVFALLTGLVMGDEVKFMQHVTGDTALTCLMLTLAVTPLRRLTGWNEIIRVRRLIGLTAFWYACLHLSTYLVFDQSLSLDEIFQGHREASMGAGRFHRVPLPGPARGHLHQRDGSAGSVVSGGSGCTGWCTSPRRPACCITSGW